MAVDELHEKLSTNTILILSLVIGLLLLFGTWDAESALIAAVIAGAIIVYLVKYKSINLEWET